MSGFEAGIALAILPLLISAVEHYDDCLSPFARFKNFPKEAGRFIKLFNIQKAIFHNQCRILLEEVIEQDAAASMLRSSEHPFWCDTELEIQIVGLLDKSKVACADTIELINEKLSEVGSECQDLVTVMCNSDMSQETSSPNVKLKRRMFTKVRFSFSKSRLSQDIDTLRALNDDFGTLASQTIRPDSTEKRSIEKASKEVEEEIKKYNIVAKASRQVYKALGQACTKHVEHFAHTCAEVEFSVLKDGSLPHVKFRMALAGSMKQKDPISFIIDATIDEVITGNDSSVMFDAKGLDRTLKRHLERSSESVERKAKRSVRFESSVIEAIPMHASSTITNPFTLEGRLNRDFCDYLRHCQTKPIKSHVCVGTLQSFEGCKNAVFLGSTNVCSQSQQAILLGQLIASSSRQKSCRISQLHERLRLAKVLTIAVLQYRSTPWLQMSWKSNDVVFFGTDAESMLRQDSALTAPHFNARVKGPEEASNSDVVAHHCLGARNPLLYSLGVVLLEIAYWTNWESLKRPFGERDRYSDFYQARRLLKSGCSDMGPKYDQVVEKLIECDFGCGDDLNTICLQTAVYRDVVCPLERLESGFRALQIGP